MNCDSWDDPKKVSITADSPEAIFEELAHVIARAAGTGEGDAVAWEALEVSARDLPTLLADVANELIGRGEAHGVAYDELADVSIVTEAELGDHPLIETPEACLLKAGSRCGRCIAACPVGALEPAGIRRRRCWDRLLENRSVLAALADLPEDTQVCGKCAAVMPCSFSNPVRRLRAAEVA